MKIRDLSIAEVRKAHRLSRLIAETRDEIETNNVAITHLNQDNWNLSRKLRSLKQELEELERSHDEG